MLNSQFENIWLQSQATGLVNAIRQSHILIEPRGIWGMPLSPFTYRLNSNEGRNLLKRENQAFYQDSAEPQRGFLCCCVRAALGGCHECLSLGRLNWDCSNSFLQVFCVSVFKRSVSLCNFLYWFIRNCFHVCCTINSSISPWLICTKEQLRLEMLSNVELMEICQCLKLPLHKRFFFLFSLAATGLHYHS